MVAMLPEGNEYRSLELPQRFYLTPREIQNNTLKTATFKWNQCEKKESFEWEKQ